MQLLAPEPSITVTEAGTVSSVAFQGASPVLSFTPARWVGLTKESLCTSAVASAIPSRMQNILYLTVQLDPKYFCIRARKRNHEKALALVPHLVDCPVLLFLHLSLRKCAGVARQLACTYTES
jgi:hypothetical protein